MDVPYETKRLLYLMQTAGGREYTPAEREELERFVVGMAAKEREDKLFWVDTAKRLQMSARHSRQ